MITNYSKLLQHPLMRLHREAVSPPRLKVKQNSSWGIFGLLLMLCFMPKTMMAQSSVNYTFATNTTGSLALDQNGNAISMSSGTTTMVGPGLDAAVSPLSLIGFDFYFMGNRFTQFSVQEDGILQLGATLAPTNTYTIAGGTATSPRLSAFNADFRTGITTGKVHYKLVGTSPNRALVVEFTDMQLFYTGTGTAGTSTWQMRLYENGNIEYVYGAMSVTDVATGNRAPSIGFYTAGTTGNFASVLYTTNANSTTSPYAANGNIAVVGVIPNVNSTADGSRRVYSFTPSALAPANPTGLTFSAVTPISTTLNWIDSSTNEFAFLVTRATDAAFTTNVVNTTVSSSTSGATGGIYVSSQTGLTPSTQYYYRIVAIQEGPARLSGLTDSNTTSASGVFTSVASGLWSSGATWSTGTVPTAGDSVIIATGTTVTQDASTAVAYSLNVSGALVYDVATTAKVLNVTADVTVNATGSIAGPATGTVVTHGLTLGGNLVNNGVLDFSTNANNAGVVLTFTGSGSTSFTGTGATTDLFNIVMSKSSRANIVDINLSNFTVRELATGATGTLLTSNVGTGTIKFSGTNTFDGTVWGIPAYVTPAALGFWLNNPNFTVNGQAGSPTHGGLLQITSGTFNIGTATGNSLGFSTGSSIIVEGGTVNAAARFGVSAAANSISYTQTGGTINVSQIGNTSSSLSSFDLGTSTTSVIVMTGGIINVVQASTATSTPRDLRGGAVSLPYAPGTVINFGTAVSGSTGKTFYLAGNVPSFIINNLSANHSVSLSGVASTFTDVTIPASSVFNLNGFKYTARGATLTNNGTINGTTASSDLYFSPNVAQTYTGTGTVTAGLASLSVDSATNNVTIASSTSGINTLRVNLYTGTLINSNLVTIGTGAALAAIVQTGVAGLTSPGGNFDVAPIFNLGTGTYSVIYQQESVQRTSGLEIPATRTVTNVTVNNTNGVAIAEGNLEVSGILTLTTGLVATTDVNSLTLGTTIAAGTLSGGSATSYINGPFRRAFVTRTATGTYTTAATLFPVGKPGSYLPMYIDPTVTGPVTLSGEAFATNTGTPGGGVVTLSAKRWEALVKSGNTNFTNSFIRLSDAGIVTTNKILQSPTATGDYASILPATNFATGILTTGTAIAAANYTGFFAYGDLNICPAPTAQATAFTANNVGSTFFTGSFTAATGTPSHYLVVRYPAGSVVTNPADFTVYATGATLGLGTIATVLTAPTTTFNQTGLTLGTAYDYYIYSYNNVSCYGPSYNVTTPLIGTVSTCAVATTAPSALAASNNTTTGFTVSWTAVATNALELDIATNATFTNFLTGYNAKPLAAGTTSEIVTGLTSSTPYYIRIRAIAGTCYSANSTLTALTECPAEVAPTSVQTFTDYTGAAPSPMCWLEKTGTLAAATTFTGTTSLWTSSTGFANAGTNVGVKINLYGSKNDWFISNPIDLGTTPKRISYDMAVTSYNGTTVQSTLSSHKVDIVISTDGGLTWSNANVAKSYTGVGTYSNTGQTEIVNLASYSGIVKVAFVATTTSTALDIDFHIDNFKIEAIALPTITSFASTVSCGDSTVLTITGTNLIGSVVTINGTPFTPTTISNTQVVIPVNTTIAGNIVITTPGGAVTSATPFAFGIAPALTLSANTAAICNGTSSSVINVTAGGSDYDTYVWLPANGVTGTATTGFTFNASVSNVYTLTASQSTGSCSRTATFNLTVSPLPAAVTIAQTSATLCQGAVQALVATGGTTSGSGTIGTATTLTGATSQLTAFCNRYDHYWSQMVFTVAELNAVGIQAGNINSIKFKITSVGSAPNVTDFKVYMGTTGASVLTAFTTTGLTQVFSAATYTQAVGVNTITFSTPYQWNGTSNLIVDIRQTGIDSANNAETYYTATTGNTVLYAVTSTVNTGGSDGFASSTPAPTAGVNRLNTTFDWSISTSMTWAPLTDLFTDVAATIPYTGTPATTVYVKGSTATPASYVAIATNAATCTSSASVSVSVTTNVAPTAVTPQAGTTLADLVTTPSTGITWYASQADAIAGTGALPLSTTLVDGAIYYATHTATCASLPTAVTIDMNLSAPSFNLNSLKYYPNPVNNILTVSYSEDITGLKLYNMVGQQLMVKTVNSTETQLDMSNLPAGSYLLEVSVGSKSKMVKLLKNQ